MWGITHPQREPEPDEFGTLGRLSQTRGLRRKESGKGAGSWAGGRRRAAAPLGSGGGAAGSAAPALRWRGRRPRVRRPPPGPGPGPAHRPPSRRHPGGGGAERSGACPRGAGGSRQVGTFRSPAAPRVLLGSHPAAPAGKRAALPEPTGRGRGVQPRGCPFHTGPRTPTPPPPAPGRGSDPPSSRLLSLARRGKIRTGWSRCLRSA